MEAILKKTMYLLILFFIVCINNGCKSEQKDWRKAVKSGTIISYKNYLDNYPKGKYLNEAVDKIDSLRYKSTLETNTLYSYYSYLEDYPVSKYKTDIINLVAKIKQNRNPDLAKITTIYLDTTIYFPTKYGKSTINSIIETLKTNCNYAFIKLSAEDSLKQQCETILQFNFHAKPLGATYTGQLTGYHYSGADINGFFELIHNGSSLAKVSFSNTIKPPVKISSAYNTPESAPIGRAYENIDISDKIDILFSEGFNLLPTRKWRFNYKEEEKLVNFKIVGEKLICMSENCIYAIKLEDGTLIWKYKKDDDKIFYENFIVDGSTIYINSSNDILFAINMEDGKEKWKVGVGKLNNRNCHLSMNYNTVFIACADGNLFAIDSEKGNTKWVKKLGNRAFEKLILGDSMVYVMCTRSLYALNNTNGSLKWEYGKDSFFNKDIVIDPNFVYLCSGKYIYCLERDNGLKRWKTKLNIDKFDSFTLIIQSDALLAYRAVGPIVLCRKPEHQFTYLIDAKDGLVKKTIKTMRGFDYRVPKIENDLIYLFCMDGYFQTFDMKKYQDNKFLLLESDDMLNYNTHHFSKNDLYVNYSIYPNTDSKNAGCIQDFNLQSGNIKWKQETIRGVAKKILRHRDCIYILYDDGRLYARNLI